MQTKPANWATLFAAPHKVKWRFEINGMEYIGSDVRGTPIITKPLLDRPAIGRCCTGSLSLTVAVKSDIPKAATVNAYCRLVSQDGNTATAWVPQGKYYVSTRNGKGTTQLNCLDRMVKAGTTYLDKTVFTEWPQPMKAVVNDIARIMEAPIDSRTVIKDSAAHMVDYPNEDVLISEILGMIAAAHAGSWIMTETGALRLIPFASPVETVQQDLKKEHSGFTSRGEIRSVSRIILTDNADNDFTSGDDSGITLSARCDYATQKIALDLCSISGAQIENGSLKVYEASVEKQRLLIKSGLISKGTLTLAGMEGIYGATYEPYDLEGAYLDPLIELGDTISVTEHSGAIHKAMVHSIKINCTVACTCFLSSGIDGETEDEFPYITMQELGLSRSIRTNQTYYGNRINRKEGFVSELLVNEEVQARLTANASEFTMSAYRNGEWVDGIYFDPIQGKYVITGEVIINGVVTFNDLETAGSTVISGDNITTGTISAERIDLSGYSTTQQVEALIETVGTGILISVSQTIENKIDALTDIIDEKPQVFTDTPVPPYHTGDLWFGQPEKSHTSVGGEWIEIPLSIPPEICGNLDSTTPKWIYFYQNNASARPNLAYGGSYWYQPDTQITLINALPTDEHDAEYTAEHWTAISSTSPISAFLETYYANYISSTTTMTSAIRAWYGSVAPTGAVTMNGLLWLCPGSDIKICLTQRQQEEAFNPDDWVKRDGYANSRVLENYRAEIKIETDQIRSTVSAQTAIIDKQTGDIEILAQNVSSITQTADSIVLQVQMLNSELDGKVSEGEVCAQIKIETTSGSGIVEIGADRLIVNSTNFKLDRDGSVSASGSFTTTSGSLITQISGGQIDFQYNPYGYDYGGITTMSIYGGNPSWGSNPVIYLATDLLYLQLPQNGLYYVDPITFSSGGAISCDALSTRGIMLNYNSYNQSSSISWFDSATLTSASIAKMQGSSGITISGSLEVWGGLQVYNGSKYRVVETKHHGMRALSAMESAMPIFADVGRAKLDDTGFAMVGIDPVFGETIDADYQYYVFLCAENSFSVVCVAERNPTYFTVIGDPETAFSWILFAPQEGYTYNRLESISVTPPAQEVRVDSSIMNGATNASKYAQAYMENQTGKIIADIGI